LSFLLTLVLNRDNYEYPKTIEVVSHFNN